MIACSGGSGNTGIEVNHGARDDSESERVSVSEAALAADIEGDTLRVEVPVQSVTGAPASGELTVRLLGVDGKEEFSRTTLQYDVPGADAQVFTATLKVPEALESQDALVEYVVRIDDGKEGGVLLTSSLWRLMPKYQVELEGPARVEAGSPASYRVRATEPLTHRPLARYELELELEENGEKRLERVTTDEAGTAVVTVSDAASGPMTLTARARAHGTSAEVSVAPIVEPPGKKLLLTTDKPIYQPGQRVHLRALGLRRKDKKPLAEQPVVFEITDGKGNKVYKRTFETDEYGVAATEFRIGPIVNEGTYTATVTSGDVSSQKTFEVFRYALPKFEVGVKTEKPWYRPAEEVLATVDARYFFGKRVSGGKVRVEAFTLDVGETVFQQVMGELDDEGHYQVAVTLPASLVGQAIQQGNALAGLRVTVTDTAGQEVQKTVSFPVAEGSVRLSVVPEGTRLVPEIENELWLFAVDPLGAPVPNVDVELTTPEGEVLEARTDAHGQAEVAYTPTDTGTGTFSARLTTPSDEVLTQAFTFARREGGEHVIVRTEKAVYETGDTVEVEVVASQPSETVYVDWLNDGQAVDMRTLKADDDGRARFSMELDATLSGDNRIEAYVVDEDGNVSRSGRTLFVRSDSGLHIDVTPDRSSYEPGEAARLTFRVTDEAGEPRAAALGVQVVDQAVFALVDAQPGLLRTYFELDDAFARPSYEIHGLHADFSRLFFVDTMSQDAATQAAAQRTSAGVLAALGSGPLMGVRRQSYPEVQSKIGERLGPHYQRAAEDLAAPLGRGVQAVIDELEREGCTPVRSCGTLGSFDAELRRRVRERVSLADYWGEPWELVAVSLYGRSASLRSNGPDETAGTPDDGTIAVPLAALEFEGGPGTTPSAGQGTGGAAAWAPPGDPAANPGPVPGAASGGANAGAPSPEGSAGKAGSDGPRVRRDFPETLFVAPSVITDGKGTAELEIPLADSITEWRVTTLAHTTDGALGGSESGITVFQDFFVDVSFPAELTRGDEVTFPIAVYNYLDETQSVSVELEAASWYTPLGETSATIELEPGQVAGIGFPVRVEEVGLRALTVRAFGSERSDAVERSVRVVPDGKAVPHVASGALAEGDVTLPVEFPEAAIPGSAQLYVDLFPAFLSQVVSGMDSMLRTPNGCFEQTTSSAWPNVLVTEYMR
ncbi:MAG TPA: MG2 domain-containing protein, partial [Polyangiaceae bacterium]|nr:MG2 domain-containing protein [Polyangiaceae bacterium]